MQDLAKRLYQNIKDNSLKLAFRKAIKFTAISIFASSALVLAEDVDSVDSKIKLQAEKIVTTASGFAQEIKNAPASISVVSGEEIQTRPARDIAEMVSNVPGVSIDSGIGRTGGYGIAIRGMPQIYTLILIDGKRVNGSPGLLNQLDFSEVTTSFVPPLNAIDHIEVIRGPMSTLYGSEAIGGVVNIITKKDFDTWNSSITIDSTLQEQKQFGNTYSINAFTQGPLNKAKTLGLQLRAREYFRSVVATKDLFVLPVIASAPSWTSSPRKNMVGVSGANMYALGSRLTYKPSDNNLYWLDIDFGDQWYDNQRGLLGETGLNGGHAKNMYFTRANIILTHEGSYDLDSSLVKTDTSLQYNSLSNKGRSVTPAAVKAGNANPSLTGKDRGLRSDDIILDTKATIYTDITKSTLGGRYWFSSLVDRVVPRNNGHMIQHTAALFAESDITLTDDLSLTLGFRENFNSGFGFNTSPRAYLVYNPTSFLTIKGGIGTGYKAPDLAALIPSVVTLAGQGTIPWFGNPDLKPESSINFELGFDLDMKYFDLSTTLFYTDFDNRISSISVQNGESLGASGTCHNDVGRNGRKTCIMYVNDESARSYGAEFYLGTKDIDVGFGKIRYDLSYTLNNTEVTSGPAKHLPFTDIPLHNLNTALHYLIHDFGVYIRGEFKGHLFRNPGERSLASVNEYVRKNNISKYYKDYFLLHLGASYNITNTLRFNVAIYNLLNTNFLDFTILRDNLLNNYNYIREGRRYYISLSYEF